MTFGGHIGGQFVHLALFSDDNFFKESKKPYRIINARLLQSDVV